MVWNVQCVKFLVSVHTYGTKCTVCTVDDDSLAHGTKCRVYKVYCVSPAYGKKCTVCTVYNNFMKIY